MRITRLRVVVMLALLALATIPLACGGEDQAPEIADTGAPQGLTDFPSGGVYLALGDSIAAGTGASDPATASYVALLAQALRSRFGESVELLSLAVPGDTTRELVDGQLGRAIDLAEQGNIGLVTITIGGNDLLAYYGDPACLPDPSDPACPLEDGLLEVEQRLDRAFAELREAAPAAAIVIQTYPNFFSGSAHEFERPADIALARLNGVIIPVARRHGVLVADPRPEFEGRSNDLTHIAGPVSDFHPNDDGHRVIADAFFEVLRLGEKP